MRVERLNAIEQFVFQKRTVSLEELAAEFNVSMNTIRRDVRELLERDELEKVYGGVSVCKQPQRPLPSSVRSERNLASKKIIGQLAAELVEDNSSIFLDSGTTTPNILPHLANKKNVTIITHSLTALYEASKYPNLNVISLGGIFNFATASYLDIASLESVSRMTINSVFIAATGVSIENGLTNTTYLEAEMKRVVVNRANRVILMADHSKFDHSAVVTFCAFNDLDCIVTDQMLAQSYLDVMEKNNIQLRCPK